MITNKDVRVENGNLVLNGDKFPLDGQSPEAIMQIVEDNSDTTPTENSDAPITSGGVYTTIGDITQTGITGVDVAAQLGALYDEIEVKTDVITLNTGWSFDPGSVNTVKKVGSIAWLSSNIFSDSALTADTLYDVGTLPAGFIPSKDHIIPIYGTDSSTLNGVITIKNNGKINYKAVNTGRYAIYTTIMYPLS